MPELPGDFARHVTDLADQRLARHLQLPLDAPPGHRELMVMIKNAVCCYLTPASHWHRDRSAAAAASRWVPVLAGLQDETGLFSSSGNVSSPPDSGFSLNDAAETVQLIEDRAEVDHGAAEIAAGLRAILERATPALVAGGVHTPNHRWELSSALARIHALTGDPAAAGRVTDWLAEGIDVDSDGIYSERSANYAAFVSNPSLLVMGDLLERPELIEYVHRNLHAQADLTDAAGLVETVFSRRQDQKLLDHRSDHGGFSIIAFLTQYGRFAGDCDRCRRMFEWTRRLALESDSSYLDPTTVLADHLSQQSFEVVPGLPEESDSGALVRVFGDAGVAVVRDRQSMITVNAGSDVARVGRVASGLACNPTFLRWRSGRAVLNSVRLSRVFFGLGPFRADELIKIDERTFQLREQIGGSYYQPLPAADRDDHGRYRLEYEGRFAAQMSFSERATTAVTLATTVTIEVTEDAVRVTAEITGPATACCFELGFAPGGEFTGGQPIGADRCLLTDSATYRVDDSAITVATNATAGPAAAAGYHPGEAYTFLGGTDAVGGPRLYLPVTAPGTFELTLRAD